MRRLWDLLLAELASRLEQGVARRLTPSYRFVRRGVLPDDVTYPEMRICMGGGCFNDPRNYVEFATTFPGAPFPAVAFIWACEEHAVCLDWRPEWGLAVMRP